MNVISFINRMIEIKTSLISSNPKRHDINGSVPDNRKAGNVTSSHGEVVDLPMNNSVMMYYYDHNKVKPTNKQIRDIKDFIDKTLNKAE